MKPQILVAVLLFTGLAFAAPDPQPTKGDNGEGMKEADFLAWLNPAPLPASDTSDECSSQSVHFGFNKSADPKAHAFACLQDGPERDWYRQRIRGLHIPKCPDKSVGASCDMTLTRICRASEIGKNGIPLPEPCSSEDGNVKNQTGPNGCGVCGKYTLTAEQP
jgi:hypothetical protein